MPDRGRRLAVLFFEFLIEKLLVGKSVSLHNFCDGCVRVLEILINMGKADII